MMAHRIMVVESSTMEDVTTKAIFHSSCCGLVGRMFVQKGLSDSTVPSVLCLQCFDAVGWAAGRASGL